MEFAYFNHIWHKENMTPHERYNMLWRELELADDHKFDYAFSVEHHCSPQESWMSSPSLFAVAAGLKTKHRIISSICNRDILC